MRKAEIKRKTAETDIELILNIDGTGKCSIRSGCGFMDHMLTLFARHGRFDIELKCEGDVYVDYHHSVEDIGIALGMAFYQALGEKRGIYRYGEATIPMDEALIQCVSDMSGRAHLSYGLSIPTEKVGDMDTELVKEFWLGFVRNAQCTLHIRQLDGENAHHIIEGAFKAAARSIAKSCSIDERYADEIPSTKGML